MAGGYNERLAPRAVDPPPAEHHHPGGVARLLAGGLRRRPGRAGLPGGRAALPRPPALVGAARLRRSTRLLPKKRKLTGWTRVALRTLFLNLLFLAALLVLWPKVAFAALATRGDWFLSDSQGEWTQRGRAVLLAAASGLEWVHTAAHDNPNRRPE